MNHRWKERSSYEVHDPRNKKHTTCLRCGIRVRLVVVEVEIKHVDGYLPDLHSKRLAWQIRDHGWRWQLPKCGKLY